LFEKGDFFGEFGGRCAHSFCDEPFEFVLDANDGFCVASTAAAVDVGIVEYLPVFAGPDDLLGGV
jgi:hypothetical protein